MKRYDHLTDALQACLLNATRGYVQGVSFVAEASKQDDIEAKWAEVYGTGLSAWKRYERKRKGLPNAWACTMPVPGRPKMRQFVLLATEIHADKLDPRSPWLREKWRPLDDLEIGDYGIRRDRRDRRDYAMTVKLTGRARRGLEQHWRALAQKDLEQLVHDTRRAVAFYPMFGGVRRQLRRLIRGYANLYEKKRGKPWPGPDPEALPAMKSFRSADRRNGGAAAPADEKTAATAAG